MTWAKLGAQLRALRIQIGLTQQEVAEKARLSNTFISHMEKGIRNPTLDALNAVCGALGARLTIDVQPQDEHIPAINLDGLGEREQALAAQAVEALRSLREGEQKRLGVRQLERWVEDFGHVEQAQEEAAAPAARPRRGEKEEAVVIVPSSAARPAARR